MPCLRPPTTGREWIVNYEELRGLGENGNDLER